MYVRLQPFKQSVHTPFVYIQTHVPKQENSMALVALGSYVQVLDEEEGEESHLEPIECVRANAWVLGGEDGKRPVKVAWVSLRRGTGIARVCQWGALRAHEKQVVGMGDEWRCMGDVVPSTVHACAGLATLYLDGATTVVVDGVRCEAVDARRLEARLKERQNNVTVRWGKRKWRVAEEDA